MDTGAVLWQQEDPVAVAVLVVPGWRELLRSRVREWAARKLQCKLRCWGQTTWRLPATFKLAMLTVIVRAVGK